ncbi:MAG TPA: tRNA preQ1(34) S-adenosylmethionine ribosyltransferase-isomerase QueA [Spirochaetota bacterium]|nr:tRNA preQ1(34) S-adenosylmethionine ribosyltransferase-isomerase QueA [Spirochaetota bacterium]HPS85380.1 tRNA preQ1(34) S-adenosylmethionine ribosyltransferase-isomerase QueA [Spirochaetota bacterium]
MKLLKTEYTLEDFYYNLPERLIAQKPAESRDESKLFILNRSSGKFTHTAFKSLIDYLNKGDLLVFNNTKVLNARIYCVKDSGGEIEIVLTEKISKNRWYIISNRTKRLKINSCFFPIKNNGIIFSVTGRSGEYIEVETSVELTDEVLLGIGEVPLPPYIKRESSRLDVDRYQTIYAQSSGAVAAPTAGLHFTDDVLNALKDKGIELVFTTLHVSWGTFSPVRENDLSRHKMHSEKFIFDNSTADRINAARTQGRRIIAVGTTSLRVLESTYADGVNVAGEGYTDIFIYPPCKIKSVDALFTNLHTPGSTLLMLVAAFAGYDMIMKAYEEAVRMEYRFFSYGDAMLII